MKTIRTNCFETNSSSTHSFTIHAPNGNVLKPCQTFIPDENGEVAMRLQIGEDESSMHSKAVFLLTYTYTIGDAAKFAQVRNVIESFAKIKLVITTKEWIKAKSTWEIVTVENPNEVNEDEINDILEDEYCSWVGDYGNGSVEDFRECVEAWLVNDQKILEFVFSDVHPFSSEAHYDG